MSGLTVGSYSLAELSRHLKTTGLFLAIGPMVFHVRSAIPIVAEGIYGMYAQHACWRQEGQFADVYVHVYARRKAWRPLVVFEVVGLQPFT